MERFYTPKQIAELLGVNEKTIRRYIHEGKIKAIRIGNRLKISETNYQNYLNNQKI